MKKPLLLAFALLSFISSSLNAQCLKVLRDTVTFSNQNGADLFVKDYIYDNSNRIVKIAHRNPGSTNVFYYDTLYYISGKLDSVESYRKDVSDFNLIAIAKNKWSGNLLLQQTRREGTDFDTTTYTYSGALPNTLTSLMSINYNSIDTTTFALTGISFTGNNMNKGTLSDPSFPFPVQVTVAYDTYPNPFYGMAFGEDFLTYFSENNVLKVYPTLSPTTPLTEKSYTYANGLMVSSSETFEDEGGEVHTEMNSYVYDCTVTNTVSSIISNQVSAFPNPSVDGKFYVEFKGLTIEEIVVISSKGELVSNLPVEINASGVNIDLSNEAKGLYLVQLKGDKEVISTKLIKQ